MSVDIGDSAPDFKLASVSDGDITLSQFKGEKHVILSFHVLDFTGGLTDQATSFRKYNAQFEENDAQVLGISCDHVAAHRAWTTAMGGLPYPELSDWHPKGKVTESYGLWNEERGAGTRAVMVVDKSGVIRFLEKYVPGTLPDPNEILQFVKSL